MELMKVAICQLEYQRHLITTVDHVSPFAGAPLVARFVKQNNESE